MLFQKAMQKYKDQTKENSGKPFSAASPNPTDIDVTGYMMTS